MTEPTTTDWRALCARMADELDHYRQLLMDDRRATHALAAEARAALAQPEPQGPSDEELLRIYRVARYCYQVEEYKRELDFARAVLARWGRPAIEPVPKQEDIHYAWELHDAEGEWQAGGSANSLEDVQREGNRYLQTYSQDGPHKLIIERHCVTTIEPVPGVEGADA
jgi:hypothetical protein